MGRELSSASVSVKGALQVIYQTNVILYIYSRMSEIRQALRPDSSVINLNMPAPDIKTQSQPDINR